MERPYNITQVETLCEGFKELKNDQIDEIIKEYPDLTKSVILNFLEKDDTAETFKLSAIEALKLDYFVELIPFLDNKNINFFIEDSASNYLQMRSYPADDVKNIAITKIAPKLESIDPTEKLNIIESLIGNPLTSVYSKQFTYGKFESELLKELKLDIQITNEKVQMALEYAEEVELVATTDNNIVVWLLAAKEEKKEKDFWSSLKDKVNNFTKNTIGNPTFRKVAAVSLAIGVALIADDAAAANVSDLNMGDVADYFNQFGDHFNENTLPKSGFSENCKVVTETIQNGADGITSKISIGDRQIIIDIKSAAVHGKGAAVAKSGISLEVLRMPNMKTGCDMDVNDYIKLGKVITKQIASLR